MTEQPLNDLNPIQRYQIQFLVVIAERNDPDLLELQVLANKYSVSGWRCVGFSQRVLAPNSFPYPGYVLVMERPIPNSEKSAGKEISHE